MNKASNGSVMGSVHALVLLLAVLLSPAVRAEGVQGSADAKWLDSTLTACAACHGKSGRAPVSPTFPVIAGQHESYLLHALAAYRDDDRSNIVMSSLVQGMTDAQLRALAEYFSSQSSGLRTVPDK